MEKLRLFLFKTLTDRIFDETTEIYDNGIYKRTIFELSRHSLIGSKIAKGHAPNMHNKSFLWDGVLIPALNEIDVKMSELEPNAKKILTIWLKLVDLKKTSVKEIARKLPQFVSRQGEYLIGLLDNFS